MRDRIKRALRRITSDHHLEARWLHTLSFLEFVGARKISKTVANSHPSTLVLDHLADETRHAHVFKSLAAELVVGEPDGYLCRDEASRYFQRLDRELSAWTTDIVGREHPALNYLLVTSMIERRAMTIYPLYRSASKHEFVRDELSTIVREEQDHRVRIEDDCVRMLSEFDINDLSAPSAVESAYFAELWSSVEAELGIEDAAAVPPAA